MVSCGILFDLSPLLLSGCKKYTGINWLFGWPKITVNIVRIKTVIHISESSPPVNEEGRRQGPQRKKKKKKNTKSMGTVKVAELEVF
jgi:hypothetical protein